MSFGDNEEATLGNITQSGDYHEGRESTSLTKVYNLCINQYY